MLREYYNDAINTAKDYLEEIYPLEICSHNDKDYPKNIDPKNYSTYKVKMRVIDEEVTLVIAFPSTFPDDLPKFYLSDNDFRRFPPLPHIDTNRFICTRDSEVVYLNQDKVGEATLQLLEIATKEIIEKGLNGENANEVFSEFLAYWNDKCDYRVLSIIDIPENIKRLKLFKISKPILGTDILVANNKVEADKWLEPWNFRIDDTTYYESIFLPLKNTPSLPLPTCNADILQLLKTNGNKFLDAVDSFFKLNELNKVILFSFKVNEKQILAGWRHKPWPSNLSKGFRSLRNLPISLRLSKSGNDTFERIQVERLDKKRLFQRVGGETKQSIENISAALIGCGSIGSTLAISLSKSGISNFTLVDKESLSVENSARHVCGIYDASLGLNKAIAIKKRLVQHFPFIKCRVFDDDVLSLLINDESILNECNLVIIATGNKGVERRLNYLMIQGIINVPIVYIWIEPYGCAGQILYINKDFNGCYDCCFDTYGYYNYSVAKNDNEFYKRESGCQSTFVPYLNIDIDHFVAVSNRVITNLIEHPPDRNLRYTWLGNIKAFEDMGFKIQESWAAEKPYSLHKYEISENQNCSKCSNS